MKVNCGKVSLQALEYLFLAIDLMCNIFDDHFGYKLTVRLSVYIGQDLCQISALILLCLLFFQSSILSAGLFGAIFLSHCYGLIISLIYLFATVILQFAIILTYWHKTVDDQVSLDSKEWTKCKVTFIWFIGQRILAIIYYISYKRVSSILHDPDLISRLSLANPSKQFTKY